MKKVPFVAISSALVGVTATLLCGFSQAYAQDDFANNWPNFRGPTYNGTSTTAQPPLQWSEDQNVKWKIELPGSGNNSSPVVWDNQVIVLTAIPAPLDAAQKAKLAETREQANQRGSGKRRRRVAAPLTPTRFITLCFDRNTGQKLWEQQAVEATPHQGTHPDHSFASASPITDGKHIYSHFGSRGLYCYDMQGNLKWKRDDFGQMMTRSGFGEGSSPFLYQETIVVPWDHEGQSWVMAIDALTGETRWKQERDEPSNWVTPLVVAHQGRTVVVTGGDNFARGYDLQTGQELWRSSGLTSRPVSAPVVHQDLVFLASSRQGFYLSALQLDGQGNLNATQGVKWSTDEAAPDVPSMLLSRGRVYFMKGSTNILNCLDAETGKKIFTHRLPGIQGVYASPVAADGKVIIIGRDGAAVVLEDADEFQILSENQLDDRIDATPALVDDQMFVRGKKFLYCIEDAS